jgi:hypothetical protein
MAACAAWAWRHEARPTLISAGIAEARVANIPTPIQRDLAPLPALTPEPPATSPATALPALPPIATPPPATASVAEEPPAGMRAHFLRNFDVTSFRRGNLHTHSNKSDGDSSPSDVYAWYRTHGYHFLIITDHNTLTNPSEYDTEPHPDFLMIGGEEVTMRGNGREVHMNALCTKRVVPGGTFPTAGQALAHVVLEIRSAGGIALINHPNFTWGVKSSDLAAAAGSNLLEIYSGHPFVPSNGRPGTPSHEAMWDITLTEGLDYMGVAVDDMHRLRNDRFRGSRPGRAWVEVFAEKLDTPTICEALENGMLYSSTGPSLRRVRVTDDTYAVSPADRNVDVVFVGSGGRVLATRKVTSGDAAVSYRIDGSEGYVRVRVVRADGKMAWTPAVRVQKSTMARTLANEPVAPTRPPG